MTLGVRHRLLHLESQDSTYNSPRRCQVPFEVLDCLIWLLIAPPKSCLLVPVDPVLVFNYVIVFNYDMCMSWVPQGILKDTKQLRVID